MKKAFIFTVVALVGTHYLLNSYFPESQESVAAIEEQPDQPAGWLHSICYLLVLATIGSKVFSKPLLCELTSV